MDLSVRLFLKRWLPIFFISGTLPFIVGLAIFFPSQSPLTRADAPLELRLWLEPGTAVTAPGTPVTLRLMASFDRGTTDIPGFSATVISDPTVELSPQAIFYRTPFHGTVTVQTITVTPHQSGEFTVRIPQDRVAAGFTQLRTITSNATVMVQSK